MFNLPDPPRWLSRASIALFGASYVLMMVFVISFLFHESLRVIDGDSFEVCKLGHCTTYHLWGVNAPEVRREHAGCDHELPLGRESREFLRETLEGGFEIIGTHGETYGEPWATVVTSEGRNISDMVKTWGHGKNHDDETGWCIERMAWTT